MGTIGVLMAAYKEGELTADEVSNQDWKLKVTAEQMLVCDICCL